MASNYAGFPATYEDVAGVIQKLPAGTEIHVWDVTAGADVAESPLLVDTNGDIASGSLAAVAAGTRIRFRLENFEGRAFSAAQLTT